MKVESGDMIVGAVRVEKHAKQQPQLSTFSVALTVVVHRLGSTGAEGLVDITGI